MVLSQPGGEAQGAAGSSPDAGGESRAGALPFLLSMFAFGVAASSQAAEAAGRLLQGCLWGAALLQQAGRGTGTRQTLLTSAHGCGRMRWKCGLQWGAGSSWDQMALHRELGQGWERGEGSGGGKPQTLPPLFCWVGWPKLAAQ